MKSFWPNVRKILNPMDMLIFLTLYLTHVRFLKFLHVITMSLRRKVHKIAVTTEYKESIFGFLERPVTMTIMFLPFVYGLDISNIVMHCLGFDFHIKGDLSRLCCVVYEAVTAGVFITKLKDFLLNLHRLKIFQRHQLMIARGDKVPFHRRDHIREGTYSTYCIVFSLHFFYLFKSNCLIVFLEGRMLKVFLFSLKFSNLILDYLLNFLEIMFVYVHSYSTILESLTSLFCSIVSTLLLTPKLV